MRGILCALTPHQPLKKKGRAPLRDEDILHLHGPSGYQQLGGSEPLSWLFLSPGSLFPVLSFGSCLTCPLLRAALLHAPPYPHHSLTFCLHVSSTGSHHCHLLMGLTSDPLEERPCPDCSQFGSKKVWCLLAEQINSLGVSESSSAPARMALFPAQATSRSLLFLSPRTEPWGLPAGSRAGRAGFNNGR